MTLCLWQPTRQTAPKQSADIFISARRSGTASTEGVKRRAETGHSHLNLENNRSGNFSNAASQNRPCKSKQKPWLEQHEQIEEPLCREVAIYAPVLGQSEASTCAPKHKGLL